MESKNNDVVMYIGWSNHRWWMNKRKSTKNVLFYTETAFTLYIHDQMLGQGKQADTFDLQCK